MSDLISRQEAIELAMQYCPDDDGSCNKADRDIRELLDDLENLPSAQPELVHCKDCCHWVGKYRYQCPMKCKDCKHRTTETFGYCKLWEQYTCNGEEFSCKYDERRENDGSD